MFVWVINLIFPFHDLALFSRLILQHRFQQVTNRESHKHSDPIYSVFLASENEFSIKRTLG
jgi:hypothetical protein